MSESAQTAVVMGRARGVDTDDAPLAGLRIVECASFVAGPSGGMTLAQLGADVIRVDPPGGGPDFLRWPLAPNGASIYWASLNKGKRSVTIDFHRPEGRELLVELACTPGPDSGIFLDNVPGRKRVRLDDLQRKRTDAVHVHIGGQFDGRPAVDYTVNAEIGLPDMTGPTNCTEPVNHVLPAWDLLAGSTAATAVLAAVHRRDRSGQGSSVDIALADVALSAVGTLGWLAEAQIQGEPRERLGNYLYGSFGVDLPTACGRRVMIVALTPRQWDAICVATGTGEVFRAVEQAMGLDLTRDADRYESRNLIRAVLEPWFSQRTFHEVSDSLNAAHALWAPYRNMFEAVESALTDENSVVGQIEQPGIGKVVASTSALRWAGRLAAVAPAPTLGADTEAILTDQLGLSTVEFGRLRDGGVVSSPGSP